MPQQVAGTEIYVWALSKQLQKSGHEVTILIPHFGRSESYEYEHDGLHVIQYAEPTRPDRQLMRGAKDPEGLPVFLDYIQRLHPSLVHFHEYNSSSGITIKHVEVVKSLGIAAVMTMHLGGYTCKTDMFMHMGNELCDGQVLTGRCAHCSLYNALKNKALSSLLFGASLIFYKLSINTLKWNNSAGTALGHPFLIEEVKLNLNRMVSCIDRIIVLTNWYKKVLQLNGVPENKLSLVQQGLPYSVAKIPSKVKAGNGVIRMVFVGRIDPLKGLHLLLQAMEELSSEKITLDIYGQVVDETYYKRCLLQSAGLPHINWKGVISQQELVPTLSFYDALCLPSSFSEMSPLVIQEAFAAGIPVIGSSACGIAEQVKHGENGLLFEFNQLSSLKKQLERLIENPSLLEFFRQNIPPVRSFEQVTEETLAVYNSVISN